MRALVYKEPGRVELEERPRPEVGRGDVEIAIEYAGICGSDISGFLGHSARRKPPLVLGHELIGRLSDGRRVVANPLISCRTCPACLAGAQNLCETWRLLGMDQTAGSFAEYVALPATQIVEIPDSLPSARAVLSEPLANIVHMFRLIGPAPFFRLAIVGAGTMGALALLLSKQIGAHDLLVVDVSDQRLDTAKKLGANSVVNTSTPEGIAEARKVAGRGFDVIVDASGSAPARQLAFDLCKPGGCVALLGMGAQRSEVDFVTSIRKEHRVIMSFAYTPGDFNRALNLLISGAVDLTPWTEQLPLERGQEAMDRISHHPGTTLKMLLELAPSS